MTPRTCVKIAIARMEEVPAHLGESRYRVVRCEHRTMLLKRKDGDVDAPNEWEFVGWAATYDLDDKEWR